MYEEGLHTMLHVMYSNTLQSGAQKKPEQIKKKKKRYEWRSMD